MAVGRVEDVLIAPPASRSTDAKSVSNELYSLALVVKQNGIVLRQQRSAWLSLLGLPHPTAPVAAFALTASAGYVQAEAQAVSSKVTELATAVAVLQQKVDAMAQAATTNIQQIGEV